MASGGNHFKNVFGQPGEIIPVTEANIETSESRRPSVVMNVNVGVNVNVNVNVGVSVSVNQEMRNLKLNPSSSVAMQAQIKEEEEDETVASNPPPLLKMSSIRSSPPKIQHNKILKASSLPLKRFRSRSLPNIWFNSSTLSCNKKKLKSNRGHGHDNSHHLRRHHHLHHHNDTLQQHTNHHYRSSRFKPSNKQLLLPPVNLQSMKEIDLQEVLKNPQLRHDILFDPQIQFRPNLDGERGQRKKILADNYWSMIENEIGLLINNEKQINEGSPINIMFETLKSILLSLIPTKENHHVNQILDTSLIIQQLNSGSFQFDNFSSWICGIFKLHCAPMRDSWVDELDQIFHEAINDSNVINIKKIVHGLRTLFSILEAMKLDVANHQIRILRPLLCSSAVSFEREYFKNATKKNKINFTVSMLWFKKNSIAIQSNNIRNILTEGVIQLLSCSNMVSSFPNTLAFDQTRLILLRADLRHVLCSKLCIILYKTLVAQNKLSNELINETNLNNFKNEFMSIIVDSHGNSKWTRNLKNLAIHICSKLFDDLNQSKIDFCFNWLLRQTQPSSQIYRILERKAFESISASILKNSEIDDKLVEVELKSIITRLTQLIDFNQNVFGDMYSSYLD